MLLRPCAGPSRRKSKQTRSPAFPVCSRGDHTALSGLRHTTAREGGAQLRYLPLFGAPDGAQPPRGDGCLESVEDTPEQRRRKKSVIEALGLGVRYGRRSGPGQTKRLISLTTTQDRASSRPSRFL